MKLDRLVAMLSLSLIIVALTIVVALALVPASDQDPELARGALAIASGIVSGLLVLMSQIVQLLIQQVRATKEEELTAMIDAAINRILEESAAGNESPSRQQGDHPADHD